MAYWAVIFRGWRWKLEEQREPMEAIERKCSEMYQNQLRADFSI